MWKSRFPQIARRTHAELSALIRKTAHDIEIDAALAAPVDTGFLRKSIQTETVDDLTSRVYVGAEYGVHVEYGTVRMRAQPFLRPALERAQKDLRASLVKIVKLA
jgi:HK97 gp10 family phage protein